MTSKNEKLRGLFLAAIMVTSVFVGSIAFAGTTAAANQAASSATDVVVGDDSATHEVVVELDGNSNDVRINVSQANSTSGFSVTGVGTATAGAGVNVNDQSFEKSNNTIVVQTDATQDGTKVTVPVNVNTTGTSPQTGLKYKVAEGQNWGSSFNVSFDANPGLSNAVIDTNENGRTLIDDGSSPLGSIAPSITHKIDLTVNLSDSTNEEFVIDLNESQENGVTFSSASVDTTPSGVSTVGSASVNSTGYLKFTLSGTDDNDPESGTVTVSVDADASNLDSDVGDIGVTYVAMDDDGNSDTQDVRVLNRGGAAVSSSGTTTNADGNSYTGTLENKKAAELFIGQQLTAHHDTEDNSVVRIYEPDRDSSSNLQLGEQVAAFGTTPGEAANFDSSSLPGAGYYLVEYNNDASQVNIIKANGLSLNASFDASNYTTTDTLTLDVETEDLQGNDVTADVVDADGNTVASSTKSLNGQGDAQFTFDGGSLGTGTYNATVTHSSGVSVTTNDVTVGESNADAQITDAENDQRGDVSEITLSLSETNTATLTVGSPDSGFVANATVSDNNGDGEVVVQWNTLFADKGGVGDNQFIATGKDKVTSQDVNTGIADGYGHVIASGTYDLAVTPGSDSTVDATDLGSVTLETRSTDSIQTWTAPDGTAAENVLDSVTEDTTIAENDLVVTQIDATGLEGAFDQYTNSKRADNSDTAAFTTLANNDVLNLTHTENLGQATNNDPAEVYVGTGTTATEAYVVADAANDTYYFVQDTGELGLSTDTDFDSTFTVIDNHKSQNNFGLVAPQGGEFSNETLEDSFETVTRTGSIDTESSGSVAVAQASGQTITGTSSVAPGTELNVRVQSSGNGSSFVIGPRTVEVADDGTWELTADFSSYQTGTEFNVRLREPGSSDNLDTAEGSIQGPPRVLSLEFSDQTRAGEVVAIDSVELNRGGFVAIHQGSPTGEVIGHSNYIAPNSPASNLRFALDEPLDTSATLYAMPHLDTNGNEEYEFEFGGDVDSPYTENGSPYTVEAQYTLSGAEADFQVSNLDPMDVTVTAGDSINVSATITNEGNAAGTQTVEFRVGGSAVSGATQEVSLDPGASTTVEFTDIDTTGLEGELEHGVFTDDGSQTATLTVESAGTPTPDEPTPTATPDEPTPTATPDEPTPTATPDEPTPTATEEEPDETTDDETTTTTGPGFGAIVALVAVLGAALLAVRRNN